MASDAVNTKIEKSLRSEKLTKREIELREQFVEEYLIDQNPYSAALRIGFSATFAQEFAQQFMHETFVRRLIQERQLVADSEEQVAQRKAQLVRNLEREANYTGPGASHGARVSALSKLAAIYGLDSCIGSGGEGDDLGGVMVIPGILSLDAWSKAAGATQAQLKNSVKD